MTKVCVVTGTRADYGLLRHVMGEIDSSDELELQIVATGAHLSPEFGLTYREIEADGFTIDRKVEMLLSADTHTAISTSIGLATIGMGQAIDQLQPDLLLLLGDRYEILAAATAALVARVPIAHLHGGEATEGAIDEAIRHSITKMSHLHFVAAQAYRDRVVQLGETPERVHIVGGLGVDSIRRTPLMDRAELESSMGFRFGPRNLLITFHPATLERSSASDQLRELLSALKQLEETHLVFTMPNADTDGRALFSMIEDFVADRAQAVAFASLGYVRYLSCLAVVDGVVGNSSSGLLEAPSFGIGTVNIGDRQTGRLKATSVIDCEPTAEAIGRALGELYSDAFQERLKDVVNPYGHGGASAAIVRIILNTPLSDLTVKRFHDLPFDVSS